MLIKERLENCFVLVFGEDCKGILQDEEFSYSQGGIWDSFAQLQLIIAIEQEFSIAIAPDLAINMINFNSFFEFVNSELD